VPARHLRVTLRCLEEDLGLSTDLFAQRDAREFVTRHPVVSKFVDLRSQAPDVGETIQSLTPFGAYRSLHTGRGRGATFWDAEYETCWLVAYSEYHATGDRKDVYNYFQRLDENGLLAPTADDFENLLSETPGALIDALREVGPQLLGEARTFPGDEIRKDFVASVQHGAVGTAIMTVDIVCEIDGGLEEGWIGLVIPSEATWPAEGALALAAALAPPELSGDDLQWSDMVGSRPRLPNEIAFTWTQQTS
jgi:hypothetical protein